MFFEFQSKAPLSKFFLSLPGFKVQDLKLKPKNTLTTTFSVKSYKIVLYSMADSVAE